MLASQALPQTGALAIGFALQHARRSEAGCRQKSYRTANFTNRGWLTVNGNRHAKPTTRARK
jgi:hypothetical protein